MCVSFYSMLRQRFLDRFFPPNHTHSGTSFQGRGTPGSPDSLLPAPPQDRAPRLFRSVFWSLVTSFLSWPPGLGRLVWAAASLLVRPFRPPTPGNQARGGGEVDGRKVHPRRGRGAGGRGGRSMVWGRQTGEWAPHSFGAVIIPVAPSVE